MNRFARYEARANQDIEEIFDYLDQRNEIAADRFYDAVNKTVQQLLSMPELGERCQFRSPRTKGMRVWQVYDFANYLLFYRIQNSTLQILRVIHGARDYAAIFNDE